MKKSTKTTATVITNSVNNAVTCPKCGTKIKIAKNHTNEMDDMLHRIKSIIASAADESAADFFQSIVDDIEESGHLEVDGIVRRWIPAQCLAMHYSNVGFHTSLKYKGANYSWRVLVNELKAQAKFYKTDHEEYMDRNRFYNKNVVLQMCQDYVNDLIARWESLPVQYCKGNPYKALGITEINNGKGLFLDPKYNMGLTFEVFVTTLNEHIARIKCAANPEKLHAEAKVFSTFIKHIRFKSPISPAFMNAYKAAGAYYTMKDLILFEGCTFDGADQAYSLDVIDAYAQALSSTGVRRKEGWELLGLMKQFLEDNEFDYEAVKQDWRKQSEERRAKRATIEVHVRRSRK